MERRSFFRSMFAAAAAAASLPAVAKAKEPAPPLVEAVVSPQNPDGQWHGAHSHSVNDPGHNHGWGRQEVIIDGVSYEVCVTYDGHHGHRHSIYPGGYHAPRGTWGR